MTLCSLIRTKFPPPSSEQNSALSVQTAVVPKHQKPRTSVGGFERQNVTT